MKLSDIKKILTGTALGLVLSCVLLFAGAVLLYATSVPESAADVFVLAATVAGILFAGIISAKNETLHGWLRGGLAGVLYMLILALISCFISGFPQLLRILISLAVGFVTGAAGGIVGINLKKKKRKHGNKKFQIGRK